MTSARFAHRLPLILLLLLPSALTHAQATTPTVPTPVYDVVSIVLNKTGDSGEMGIGRQDSSLRATNIDLKNLFLNAFDIHPDLIFGMPSWANSLHWNIEAKILDPDLTTLEKLTNDQRRAMLVQVLADRFHLKTHTEIRQLPVYNLVVTPRGPKFKQSAFQDDQHGGMGASDHDITLEAFPLSSLAYALGGSLHRTVIDKTNLPGRYDIHLTWAPDNPAAAAGQDDGRKPADDTGPSLFSALQDQLGLKLVPAKGPVTTLVIDHIDPPTPN